jgi:hypothetical protein
LPLRGIIDADANAGSIARLEVIIYKAVGQFRAAAKGENDMKVKHKPINWVDRVVIWMAGIYLGFIIFLLTMAHITNGG